MHIPNVEALHLAPPTQLGLSRRTTEPTPIENIPCLAPPPSWDFTFYLFLNLYVNSQGFFCYV